jgi:hypothetical protein
VTLAHLRGAEGICPRRLAREHSDSRGNWGSNLRWRVANRVLDDIRLAHTDLTGARPEHFRATGGLTPEQARVYELATRWYVTLFADRPARAVDEDQWATERDGVRLVGPAGLGLTDAEGNAEIRWLRLAGRGEVPSDLTTSPEVRFALLRRPAWLDGRRVRVAVADLVLGTCTDAVVDTRTALPAVDGWFHERLAAIRARIEHPAPERGLQCGRCAFIAGCPALR